MKPKTKSFNDADKDMIHLQTVVERVEVSGIDLTADYDVWVELAFALASQGEQGRELFHRVSRMNSGYTYEECDRKYTNCLATGKNCVGIATFFKIAADHGIDISFPKKLAATKGRRKMTQEQRMKSEEERKKKSQAKVDEIVSFITSHYQLRYNTWTSRPEVLEDDEWRPITTRDICTMNTDIMSALSTKVTAAEMRTYLFSRSVVQDFDPVRSYLEGLKPWNPDTDPDFIGEFFIKHIIFGDPEHTDFYDMVLRKWMVGNVALWLGEAEDNPIMPVLTGSQHIGKTYFVKHILPPELRNYLFCGNPAARIDKDFVISLSEFAIIFLDEFSFSTNAKSDAYKFIVTSGASHERDAYAQFRESRLRKAGLIGACNQKNFIKDPDGNRRYPGIDVAGTVNLHEHPLPYEGAYAQALYLLRHGFAYKPTHSESMLISEHNKEYMELNDCEETIKTYYRKPEETEHGIALTSSAIQRRLSTLGFYGKGYSAVEIGRAFSRLGYIRTRMNGVNKFVVVEVEPDIVKRQGEVDAKAIKEAGAKHEKSVQKDNSHNKVYSLTKEQLDELYS